MIFALLANPKDGVPYYAARQGDQRVAIYTLDDEPAGSGYFNYDLHDKYGFSSSSGFPRVHTPHGVSGSGKGLGTVLYSSLCAAAFLQSQGRDLRLRMDVNGPGISSQKGTRSDSAEAWWTRAKTTYGLAHEENVWSDDEVEEDVNLKTDEAAYLLKAHGKPGVVIHRSFMHVEGVRTRTGTVDVYPFKSAEEYHLVVGFVELESDAAAWREVGCEPMFYIDVPAIVALNYGSLWNPKRRFTDAQRDDIFAALLDCAKQANASKDELRSMAVRYLAHADVEDGRSRRNPSGNATELREAMGQVKKLRTKLGWDVFLSDPEAP